MSVIILGLILLPPLRSFTLQLARPQFLDRGTYSDRYYSPRDTMLGSDRLFPTRDRYTVPTGQGLKVDIFNK